MVPVRMGEKEVELPGFAGLHELSAKRRHAGPAVDHDAVLARLEVQAGGVSAVPHDRRAADRIGAAGTKHGDLHGLSLGGRYHQSWKNALSSLERRPTSPRKSAWCMPV